MNKPTIATILTLIVCFSAFAQEAKGKDWTEEEWKKEKGRYGWVFPHIDKNADGKVTAPGYPLGPRPARPICVWRLGSPCGPRSARRPARRRRHAQEVSRRHGSRRRCQLIGLRRWRAARGRGRHRRQAAAARRGVAAPPGWSTAPGSCVPPPPSLAAAPPPPRAQSRASCAS